MTDVGGTLCKTEVNDATTPVDRATVAVIIPTFNHAHFLADAITSVLAQTRKADEIIVIDDGSTDDPASVVAQFPNVKLLHQANCGLAASRNVGLQNCAASYVVFLDADDRLLPTAIEDGLACITARPDCAFVYGGYRHISMNGDPFGPNYLQQIDGDARLAFLRENIVGLPASVLYRRNCLLEVNGFDETLRRVEDHDIYLRISERYPVASHPEIVAEYRKHRQNMSNDHVAQLRTALRVLDRHEARIATNPLTRAALRDGRANKRKYYVTQMLAEASARWRTHHRIGTLLRDLMQAARWSPFFTMRALLGAFGHRARKAVQGKGPLTARIDARDRYWFSDPSAPSEVKAIASVAGSKCIMRRYIRAMGLNLPQIYYDALSLDVIDFTALPEAVVIKPDNNWGSNGVMLIAGEVELLRGAKIPRPRLRDFCRETFGHFETAPRILVEEWVNAAPRILVEEFLKDYDRRFVIPRDFKVYVAGGRAWIIQVIDRNGPKEARNHSFYTREWIKIDDRFQTSYKDGPAVARPVLLPDLVEAAELIARDTGVFSRLDFYLTTRGVVFGEFTACPFYGHGFSPFGEKYMCDLMDRFPDTIPDGWSPEGRRVPKSSSVPVGSRRI